MEHACALYALGEFAHENRVAIAAILATAHAAGVSDEHARVTYELLRRLGVTPETIRAAKGGTP